MENEVFDIQDLVEEAEIERRKFNRMTPPGFSWAQPLTPSVVPFDLDYFSPSFLSGLRGEYKNSVVVYPLALVLDPVTRETVVYNATGDPITIVSSGQRLRTWPEGADPSRVVLHVDLVAFEDVEPFLYVQRRIRESQAEEAARATEGESVSMRSSTAFHISGMIPLATGHVQVTVTNAIDLVEIYATTVWHTSSVAVVTWTNDLDEVVTSTNELWHAVSPSFSGIERGGRGQSLHACRMALVWIMESG